ncbi:hypothetical protein CH063_02875, partial [Colletotrichum higginsianum]
MTDTGAWSPRTAILTIRTSSLCPFFRFCLSLVHSCRDSTSAHSLYARLFSCPSGYCTKRLNSSYGVLAPGSLRRPRCLV